MTPRFVLRGGEQLAKHGWTQRVCLCLLRIRNERQATRVRNEPQTQFAQNNDVQVETCRKHETNKSEKRVLLFSQLPPHGRCCECFYWCYDMLSRWRACEMRKSGLVPSKPTCDGIAADGTFSWDFSVSSEIDSQKLGIVKRGGVNFLAD